VNQPDLPALLELAFSGDSNAIHEVIHLSARWAGECQAVRAKALLNMLLSQLQRRRGSEFDAALVSYELGQILLKEQRLEESAQAFLTSEQLWPRVSSRERLASQASRAFALSQAGVSQSSLLAEYGSLIPKDLSVVSGAPDLQSYGLLLYSLGQLEGARFLWKRVQAADISPTKDVTFDSLINLAALEVTSSNVEKASAYLDQIRDSFPARANECAVLVVHSDIHAKEEKWSGARNVLLEAEAVDASDPEVQYRLGVVAANQGNIEQAEKYFERTVATSPWYALRFNYLYSEDELQEFVEPVEQLARQSKQVHVMFNNCYEDKAQVNARKFMAMLEA
jgi:tetratricopeptide (TPR) repeat protein